MSRRHNKRRRARVAQRELFHDMSTSSIVPAIDGEPQALARAFQEIEKSESGREERK